MTADRIPRRVVTRDDLGAAFFQDTLRASRGEPGLLVDEVRWGRGAIDTAILSALPLDARGRFLGVHRVEVTLRAAPGRAPETLRLILKSKPLGAELLHAMGRMAQLCGRALATAFADHAGSTIFGGTHLRELAIYAQEDPRLRRYLPRVEAVLRDDARELYAVILEDLSDAAVIDAVDDPAAFTRPRLAATIDGLAALHAVWLGREPELLRLPWLGVTPTAARTAGMASLWSAMARWTAQEQPALLDEAALRDREHLVETLASWWPALEAMPRTLVHNDFNPRNFALRERAGRAPELSVFDWELATLHVPQVDLAELLAHVLPPDVDLGTVEELAERHRAALERRSGRPLPPAAWREGLRLALRDFTLGRLGFLGIGHAFRPCPFVPRVFATTRRLRSLLGDLP